ncbi:MAG: ABC transporter ATP-binding protein [Clostridia bacterium]|nr:ABC transporter ATP-binding protein [Clostridia bacterium]
MKHLLSCLKAYRIEAVLAPLFKLLEAGMELVVPLVVAAVIENGVKSGNAGYIVNACLLLVGFGLIGLGFALTAQYFAAKAAVGTSAELRGRLFNRMQSFSFTQIDGMGTSSMLTRMSSDVNQVQTGVNMTLRLFLRSPIVVFGAVVMAFAIDVWAGTVFLCVIPLLAIVVFTVMALCIPRYRAVQEKLDGIYLSARENLKGARVIRAFRMEDKERVAFKEKSVLLAEEQVRVGKIAALSAPITYALVNIAVIALIAVGALRVDFGALGQGNVVALYNYLALILVELVKFANLIVTITRAVSCMKRIGVVLDTEGEREKLASPIAAAEVVQGIESCTVQKPHVSFENVSFTYAEGGAPALQNISFTASRGETIGVLGGTGCGKSTLVRLLPRFYEATEGCVKLCGEDVNHIPVTALRERIGYVPQRAVLFRGSIASNLKWGRENATDEELLRAVDIAQAADVLSAKGGLCGEIAQDGRNLSGGQRQRLTIARALVKNPEILVLDDSSSALDYVTDAHLRAALKTLTCTVFIVSQRVASVMNADKILVLDEGRIVGMGTHKELMQHCAHYREIYESQSEEGHEKA